MTVELTSYYLYNFLVLWDVMRVLKGWQPCWDVWVHLLILTSSFYLVPSFHYINEILVFVLLKKYTTFGYDTMPLFSHHPSLVPSLTISGSQTTHWFCTIDGRRQHSFETNHMARRENKAHRNDQKPFILNLYSKICTLDDRLFHGTLATPLNQMLHPRIHTES